MKKKWIYFLFLSPFALHLFGLFFLHFKGNLNPSSFAHGFKESYVQEVCNLDYSSLDPIFSQSFHVLGIGKQMVALVSEDQKYVLKLFNPMRPLNKRWYLQGKYWKRYSSLKWIKRECFGKKKRLEKLFKRHKLAYEFLKEETGLIFVHLSPSKRVCHLVTIVDEKGKTKRISLADTPFALQKKATLAFQYLSELKQQNKTIELAKALHSIENLFEKRAEKKIADRIQTMENNYGFVEDRPIQLDVGRIHFDPTLDTQTEKKRVLSNFHTWILSQEF